jgi:predicted metal-dependent HD superfamily phosphohydrolase
MHTFFYTLLNAAGASPALGQICWQELTAAYTEPHRAYHTLEHIRHLIGQLQVVKPLLQNPTAVYLAAFYHDCIYDPARSDNEIRSAQLSAARLLAAGVPEATVQRVIELIEATQHHEANGIPDGALFLDADLSILGAAPERYRQYAHQIRVEYCIYPDAVYRSGRAQVLRSLLDRSCIFQTPVFGDRYEAAARRNLQEELQQLSGTVAES